MAKPKFNPGDIVRLTGLPQRYRIKKASSLINPNTGNRFYSIVPLSDALFTVALEHQLVLVRQDLEPLSWWESISE